LNTLRQKVGPFTHEILLAITLLVLLLAAGRIDPRFTSAATQQGLFFNLWNLAILALPMTCIIITGGIDLSVGSAMALASVTLGMLYQMAGWPIWAAAMVAVLVGVLCGLLNGIFITKVRVHPLIVTLATYSAFRGLAEGLSLGLAAVYHTTSVYSGFPSGFTGLGQHALLAGSDARHPPLYALPIAGWVFIVAAIVMAIVLAKTRMGRALYAIGFNETATRFSGIHVDRIKLLIYTLSGLAAGLVSLNYSAYNDTAQANVGTGLELEVITAVVLGGTSIFGGRGRIIGTVLGVALIHETREFISFHFHQNELVRLILGILLIVVVAINALLSRKSARN
jgi:rhamnose transport system permease protein